MTRLFFLFLVMLCAPLRAEFAVSGGSGKINSAIAEVGQALAHLDSAQLETLLSQALQSYGYYQAKADIQGEGNNRKVKLTMGPTVKISAVNLDIPPTVRNLDAVKTLLESKPFKVNSALDHATYEQFKTTLNDALGDHGFIENTSVEGQILVDRVKRTAEINITVKTGARATFGKVIGPEDDEIKLAVLQSWATFQAGEPYDIAQIEAFSELLYTAGFFDTVYVSPEPNPETQAVDVKINGKYKAEYIGAFGLGVSTDSGLRTSFDLQAPHSHSNGHSAALHAEVALEQQSLDMRWRVPRDKNPNHHFNELKLGWQQNKASAVPSRTLNVGVDISDMTPSNWRREVFVRAQFDRYGETFEDKSSQLSTGIRFSRNEIDESVRPMTGRYIEGELSGSSKELLSEVDMLRIVTSGYWITQRGDDDRLLYRAKIGALTTDNLDKLPPSQRFFAGGDRNVRGFALESVAPINSDGVLGGQVMAMASAEYERIIKNSLAGIGYVDGAYLTSPDAKDVSAASVGVGVRYFSPIGAVSLSVARGLTEQAPDYRIHFTIGTDY